MEVANSNFQGAEKKNNSFGKNIGASFLAAGVSSCMPVVSLPAAMVILPQMQKVGKLPDDMVQIMHDKAEEAIKVSGLDKAGVKIKYIPAENVKKPFIKLINDPIAMIKKGMNAAYLPKKNKILMPAREISFAAFHEIGHAMNNNFSKIGKTLQSLRLPGLMAASAIALFGAFTKTSKSQGGKELTKWQKFKNFVRDNAGKLSFAAMLPMLTEEAMATIKGQKLAKKLLSPDMFKVVSKGNKIAYLSYIGSAVAMGLSSTAAVKIKDWLVDRKANK